MANRYWVGGNGTWDGSNTANWSTSSGGAGGASVPTIADAAYFDANSGDGDVVVASGAIANFITAFPFNGSLTFTADWGTGITLGTGGFFLRGEYTFTIPLGVTVRVNYAGIEGGTSTASPNVIINGTLEVTEDCIINDSNTVLSEVTLSGSGEIVIGGDPSFPYFFCRRQEDVNIDIRFLGQDYSSIFVFSDGQATTFKKITKQGTADFVFDFHNNQLTVNEFIFSGGNLYGYIEPINILDANIRNATIQDVHATSLIIARNCVDGGNNTNINFITVPVNLQTTPTGIINEPTVSTSTTNQGVMLSSVINTPLTPRVLDSLWLSSTMPWELDAPWEYENELAYNTQVNNLEI